MHHDTPEVQAQVVAALSAMFRKIVVDEDIDVDPDLADTAAFVEMDGDVAIFSYTYDELGYTVDLTEEIIDGILNSEEDAMDFLDCCVYGVISDMEDYIHDAEDEKDAIADEEYPDTDEDDDDEEDDEDE